MLNKIQGIIVAFLLTAAWCALSVPAIAADQPFNPNKRISFRSGVFDGLSSALQLIHDTTGAQFVILGGEKSYPKIDIWFGTVTTQQAVNKVAAAAHATVTRCGLDTYLFQPATKEYSRKLFVPQNGFQWRKLVLPYPLSIELADRMRWDYWDNGWHNDYFFDQDTIHFSRESPNPDHTKLPPGVNRVYALPEGRALLVYSTENGFHQVRNEVQKTDLRRIKFAVSALTARTTDIQALGTIRKIITNDQVQSIVQHLPSEFSYYKEDVDEDAAANGDTPGTDQGIQAKPDDLSISLTFTIQDITDDSMTLNTQATLLQFSTMRLEDGSFPPNKTLSTISETDTLHYGEVLALQGLSAPASADKSADARQTILFIKMIATPRHPQKKQKPDWENF